MACQVVKMETLVQKEATFEAQHCYRWLSAWMLSRREHYRCCAFSNRIECFYCLRVRKFGLASLRRSYSSFLDCYSNALMKMLQNVSIVYKLQRSYYSTTG